MKNALGIIWKLVGNWRKVATIITQVAEVAKDKQLTEEEVRAVLDSVLPLAIEMGLVKDEAQEPTPE